MRRFAALAVAVCSLYAVGGCADRCSNVDPFWGRTRVVPPATGCYSQPPIQTAPSDPSYDGSLRPGAMQGTGGAGQINPTSPQTFAPADGLQPLKSSRAESRSAPLVQHGDSRPLQRGLEPNSPSPESPVGQVAASSAAATDRPAVPGELTIRPREPTIRIVEPTAVLAAHRPSRSESHVAGAPDRVEGVVDIVDLPNGRAIPESPGSPPQKGGIQLASATAEADSLPTEVRFASLETPVVIDSPLDNATETADESARYGYDSQYGWLRGKLEYSPVKKRWKLRYIPIDGATDEHGGSVVLSDASALGGCERGDFVEVRGQPADREDGPTGVAPEYDVSSLKRLDS